MKRDGYLWGRSEGSDRRRERRVECGEDRVRNRLFGIVLRSVGGNGYRAERSLRADGGDGTAELVYRQTPGDREIVCLPDSRGIKDVEIEMQISQRLIEGGAAECLRKTGGHLLGRE